jgi:hypothetical protein
MSGYIAGYEVVDAEAKSSGLEKSYNTNHLVFTILYGAGAAVFVILASMITTNTFSETFPDQIFDITKTQTAVLPSGQRTRIINSVGNTHYAWLVFLSFTFSVVLWVVPMTTATKEADNGATVWSETMKDYINRHIRLFMWLDQAVCGSMMYGLLLNLFNVTDWLTLTLACSVWGVAKLSFLFREREKVSIGPLILSIILHIITWLMEIACIVEDEPYIVNLSYVSLGFWILVDVLTIVAATLDYLKQTGGSIGGSDEGETNSNAPDQGCKGVGCSNSCLDYFYPASSFFARALLAGLLVLIAHNEDFPNTVN